MRFKATGSLVAIVTPMTESGVIDHKALLGLVDRHLKAGTQGIVLHGSTGEGISLTHEERLSSLKAVIAHVQGRISIIAGTGTASTAETIHHTQVAYESGADAVLIVTPYYNRPTQEGLYQHFKAIAKAVPIPIILYTNPSRSVVDFTVETLKRLSEIPTIVGLKDPRGDLLKQQAVMEACGSDFLFYSGDDPSCLETLRAGGQGVISITANAAPDLMQQLCHAALNQDFTAAHVLNEQLMPLHRACCIESNPIPIKWALAEMGWIKPYLRLPLTPLSVSHHILMREALKGAAVL